jgi:replicative superfamily II helicase
MDLEEANQVLTETHELITAERFRNFVAQAHSRAILQRHGVDPSQWPGYARALDDNLLDTAHLVFWQGLQLRSLPEFRSRGNDLIKQGAEILEFLYSEASSDKPGRLDQLFNAALGYYISGNYAQSYVLMKDLDIEGDVPREFDLLRRLFLRDLVGLRNLISQILRDDGYSDRAIASRLRDGEATEEEALDRVLRASLNRALSYFIEFPKRGRREHITRAKEILDEGVTLAEKTRFVDWWWLFYCARYLFDEFDANSLWTQLGPLQDDDRGGRLVEPYIRTSYRLGPPVVELWRSQTAALPRINEAERRSYCLKMPTSAGKTRVAELAILRFLLDYRDHPESKCIYVAPFRSLAVELEASLRQTFQPLGVRVSELYGGFELSPIERLLMEQTRIIVATPEKIDAFLRYNPEFSGQIRLVVIDEGHIISPTERGVRFEFFLHRLVTRFANRNVRIFFLSAVLPNINQFAAWITGSPDNVIESDWRPSRLMLGELRWNGRIVRIDFTHSGHEVLEHECYVSSFIQPLHREQLPGTRRRNPFPNNMQEVIVDAALRFAQQDMTLVFVAQQRSAEPFGRRLLTALKIKDTVAQHNGERFQLSVSAKGRQLLEECISLARETMGNDADMIKFLEAGFIVHHGDLPQRLRIKIEQLARQQVVKLVVATTTLAQGVNFPIRTVIVHSLWHGRNKPLSPLDFWNICGRAGRGMKENEGQVLFAVDQTLDAQRRRREVRLRQNLIEGYRDYSLVSALRQLLNYIVRQWNNTHPGVNVAELCQLLAENTLDWVSPEERGNMVALLDFLDAQLVALAEDQDVREIRPEDLQELLQRSLLILQLNSEPEGVLTAELANGILSARLQSIYQRFPSRTTRRRFYRLGFPLMDCENIENDRERLLRTFLTSHEYYQWNPETRANFLGSILDYLFGLQELKPEGTFLPRNLMRGWQHLTEQQQLNGWQQLENWRRLWKAVLNLWLRGYTPNEIVEDPIVAEVTDSPAVVSLLIDDLFGYRAPWGLSALSVYLEDIASQLGQDFPLITNYFPSILKYGAHSPVACSLLAFGIDSRKIALRLAERCPDESMNPQNTLIWFIGLTQQELADLGFSHDEILAIIDAQNEAQRITRMTPRQRQSWTFSVTVEHQTLGELQEGDALTLLVQPENGGRSFGLYTLWGNPLGTFDAQHEIPTLWSYPDRIDVTVVAIERENDDSSLTVEIQEV